MIDETQNYDPQDIQATKGLACLSYIGILFLIPMLVNKDSQFTKFHVNQGIVLLLADIILGIGAGILCAILAFIPIVGWILSLVISAGIPIVLFVFLILGLVNALQGTAKRLPIIGNIQIYK